jgi:hypothetical protein
MLGVNCLVSLAPPFFQLLYTRIINSLLRILTTLSCSCKSFTLHYCLFVTVHISAVGNDYLAVPTLLPHDNLFLQRKSPREENLLQK